MCELFTISAGTMGAAQTAAIAVTVMDVVGVASAAMSAMNVMQQASAQKSQASYQAAVQRNNQIIAERQAADAIDRGNIAVQQHRLKVQQFKGRQRSVLASSGFDANEDDALDILADTAEIGEMDALTIRNNAEREAYQSRLRASNAGAQAGLLQNQSDRMSPAMTGAATGASGLATVADRWYTRNPNVFKASKGPFTPTNYTQGFQTV